MRIPYSLRSCGGRAALNGGRKAAFFDRDGTINEDVGYLHRPEELVFIPKTADLIRLCNKHGYLVIVVTNQSGIARGMYTEKEMRELHRVMNDRLQKEYGAHIDAFYFCPHLEEITGPCSCRKPMPGLFLQAIQDYGIDPQRSISFGDSARDETASRAAGIRKFFYIRR